MGPHFWGVPGELLKQILGEKIAFAAQQFHTKIRFRCFVISEKNSGEDLGRKKKRKKGKKRKKERKKMKLIAAKNGLVGIIRYFKTYDRVKYFLPLLSRF